jgi:hypothetical protein
LAIAQLPPVLVCGLAVLLELELVPEFESELELVDDEELEELELSSS